MLLGEMMTQWQTLSKDCEYGQESKDGNNRTKVKEMHGGLEKGNKGESCIWTKGAYSGSAGRSQEPWLSTLH